MNSSARRVVINLSCLILLQLGSVGASALTKTPDTDPGLPINSTSMTVGATAGSFRVDETGGATYQIPILTLPGTAGVTPELSLGYNSSSGNGPLGLGWNIGGVGYIVRCGQTMFQDGSTGGGITFTANDRFCMNGDRLDPVSGSPSLGNANAEYRTSVNQFVEIFSFGGSPEHPDYWEVHGKDGSVTTFGQTGGIKDSENQAMNVNSNGTTGTGSLKLYAWGISKFSDSAGNKIRYKYLGGSNSTGHRIDEIRWGYGSTTGSFPWNGHSSAIKFHYQSATRTDPQRGFLGGYVLESSKLLDRIEVFNGKDGGSVTSIREYKFDYQDQVSWPTGTLTWSQIQQLIQSLNNGQSSPYQPLSRLVSIEECETVTDKCLQPTTFTWAGDHINFQAETNTTFGYAANTVITGHQRSDIDDDGLNDLIWIESRISGTQITKQTWKYALASGSNGTSFGSPFTFWVSNITRDHKEPVPLHVFDYNGDSLPDVLVPKDNGNWQVKVSTGSTTTTLAHTWNGNTTNYTFTIPLGTASQDGLPTGISANDAGRTRLADMDSNGLPDLVVLTDPGTPSLVEPEYGVHYLDRPAVSDPLFPYAFDTTVQTIDASFTLHCNPALAALAAPWHNTGVPEWQNLDCDSYSEISTQYIANADFNGDGRVDSLGGGEWPTSIYFDEWGLPQVAFVRALRIYVSDDNGDLQEQAYLCDTVNCGASGGSNSYIEDTASAPDINGDGLSDIVAKFGDDSWKVFINTGDGFFLAQSLTDIPDEDHIRPTFVDYNLDGWLDIAWHNDSSSNGQMKFRLWEGSSFGTQVISMSASGDATTQHVFSDINGDGFPDYTRLKGNSLNVGVYVRLYEQPGTVRNKITKIDNGLGNETNVSYQSLSQSSGHYGLQSDGKDENWGLLWTQMINGGDKDYPVIDVKPATFVVTSVQSSAPKGNASTPGNVNHSAKSTVSYFYEGAKIQGGGHGFLGFQQLSTYDWQTSTAARTRYRQDYPFVGRPLSAVTEKTGGLVVSGATSWALQDWISTSERDIAPYPIVEGGNSSTQYDTANLTNIVSHSGTTHYLAAGAIGYDEWGNDTWNRTDTYAGSGTGYGALVSEVETTSTYNDTGYNAANDTLASKKKGRLTRTEVEYRRPGLPSINRVSTFDYHDSGNEEGLLEMETIEPGTADELITTYSYDAFGNVEEKNIKESVNAPANEIRKTKWDYDSVGRYKLTEQVWNGSTWLTSSSAIAANQHSAYGMPLLVTDMNGVNAVQKLDHFGAPIYSFSSTGTWTSNRIKELGKGNFCPNGTEYYQRIDSAEAGDEAAYSCMDRVGREIRRLGRAFDGSYNGVDTEYTSTSKVLRVSEPFKVVNGSSSPTYWTTSTYDEFDRISKVTAPDGSETNTIYSGLTFTTINDLGQKQTDTKNALGEIVLAEDHYTTTIAYEYNAAGNLTETNAGGVVVSMEYNDIGQKKSMNDPNKGQGDWEYSYNGFGELVEQKDSQGQRSVHKYDAMGRLYERKDYKGSSASTLETTSTWVFDTDAMNNAIPGLLASEATTYEEGGTTYNFSKVYVYESPNTSIAFRRLASVGTIVEGDTYTETLHYDELGRNYHFRDASGSDRGTEKTYNQYGFVTQVKETSGTGEVFYENTSADVRGNTNEYFLGSTYRTQMFYDNATGRLEGIETALTTGTSYQELWADHDTIGNVKWRDDRRTTINQKESFCYDNLNRLVKVHANTKTGSCSGVTNENGDFQYNAIGNMGYKKGVGSYTYGSATVRPHAVIEAGGTAYGYDDNGNMTSGDGRTINYTTYDKAYYLAKGTSATVNYRYGADRSRYVRVDNASSSTKKITHYVGKTEFIKQYSGSSFTTKVKRHIDGKVIKIINNYGATSESTDTRYLLRDHLGSIATILEPLAGSANNGWVQDLSFDPWGQRRSPNNWTVLLTMNTSTIAAANAITERGFTGHEMVDSVGVIHMNGRIYDAKLARFMQADPLIQAPTSTQSHNRYSYVMNNPLALVDPSGYGWLSKFWKKIRTVAAIAVAAVAAIYTGGIAGTWAASAGGLGLGTTAAAAVGGAVGGFVAGVASTAIMGGNLRQVLQAGAWGAVSGAAFGAIGAGVEGSFGKVAAHSIAGGVLNTLQGGKFGHGFFSAGFTKFASLRWIDSIKGVDFGHVLKRTAVASLVGGTVSQATGGKFANGARTAALAQLFNADGKNILNSAKMNGLGAALRGFGNGVVSIFKGTAKTFRFIGRGTGLLGSSEHAEFNREEAIVDRVAKTLATNKVARNEAANQVISAAQNVELSSYNIGTVTGRLVTGTVLAPLGILAGIGDFTSAVEAGVESGTRRLTDEVVESLILGQ